MSNQKEAASGYEDWEQPTRKEEVCPIRADDTWPRWLKMRDGSVIWFDEIADWDGEWIKVTCSDDNRSGHGSVGDHVVGDTVGAWINCRLPLRATSIRWSEVVAHGEVGS
jgi:hypothetical protein